MWLTCSEVHDIVLYLSCQGSLSGVDMLFTPCFVLFVDQVIAYLAGLHYSGMFRPSLVVCPATVMRQWMRELRVWYPPLRVMLLHDSGRSPFGSKRPDRTGIVDLAIGSNTGVVLTTYEHLRLHRELLLPVRWGVVVLDEGHKIRNPDSEITLVCKQVSCCEQPCMPARYICSNCST